MIEMEISGGMNLPDAILDAQQKAITEETDVFFVFNGKTHTTTPEEARCSLNKRFTAYIDSLCQQEANLVGQVTQLRVRIEEERQFANQYLGLTIAKKRFTNPKNPKT